MPRAVFDHSGGLLGIMIIGALGLVEVAVGMTEASTTVSPSSPCTHSWSSTTAIRSPPILQVQVTW